MPFRPCGPVGPIGCREQLTQTVGGRRLPADRGKTDDTVGVGEFIKTLAAVNPRPHFLGKTHILDVFRRPPVAEQSSDSDMEDGRVDPECSVRRLFCLVVPDDAAARMTVEDPLREVVRVGFGETIRIHFGGYT